MKPARSCSPSIRLVAVLALGAAVVLGCAEEAKPLQPDPTGWDLSRVPPAGPVLRSIEGEQGLVSQVVAEGEGEPLSPELPMSVQYTLYTLEGKQVDRGTIPDFAPAAPKTPMIAGFLQGLVDIKLFERRRVLVPPILGYKEQGKGPIPPNARLVFDLRPVRLVVTDLVVGTGVAAKLGDTIKVHYTGRFENGAIFDSSIPRGEPTEFPLRDPGLIKGWTLGLPGMKVGGKRKLWVPSHLAYGPGGRPPIPPHTDLQFEVELLGVR